MTDRASLPAIGASRQRGVISVLAAFLLVAGVVFVLAQAAGMLGNRSMDTSNNLDSTAALMLAESGLQRAEAIVGRTGNSGIMSEADCTGVATGGPFPLGRGSFTYSTPVADPPGCTEGLCNTCTVGVTGTVGSASRTLQQTYKLGVSYGVAGRGTTVTMVLRNTNDVPATSLFNMVWKRQDPGGNTNAEADFCGDNKVGCALQWNLNSSSGNTAVGGIGVTVDIAANTVSRRVNQTISQSRDYVEVGGLFPSVSTTAAPTVVGSFWDDRNGSGHQTGVNAGSTGAVVNGVATTSSTCTAAPTTYPSGGTGSYQLETCTSWCSASDTLVYGFSGRSQTSADQLTAVTFGTNGPNPSAMTNLVHFPNIDGSTPNASGKAYSEIWFLFNPDYLSANADHSNSAGLTSYPSAVKATAGANPVLSANLANNDTTMTVTSLADSNSRICQGDVLSGDPNINGAVITSAGCNSTGTFTFSPKATGNVNKNNVVVSSTRLRVQGSTGAALQTGTANVRPGAATISIVSGPSSGDYTLSSATNLGGTVYVTQGASSTTIRVPAGTVLPSLNPYVSTTLSVFGLTGSPAGAGVLQAGTKVVSVGTDSFTVSAVPSTGLYGAKVCGGLCAFFNSPSDASATTGYSVARSGGTLQFASGFVCLRGVDYSKITRITSTTLRTNRWQETVQ